VKKKKRKLPELEFESLNLSTLNRKQKKILIEKILKGKAFVAIAKKMKLHPQTVRYHYAEAIKVIMKAAIKL